jgi:hypothetical protein
MAVERRLRAYINILQYLSKYKKKKKNEYHTLISNYISYSFIYAKSFLTAYCTGSTVHPI